MIGFYFSDMALAFGRRADSPHGDLYSRLLVQGGTRYIITWIDTLESIGHKSLRTYIDLHLPAHL